MKVSLNVATAKPTTGHNDRSMYAYGYENRAANRHATFEGEEVTSGQAERLWYELNMRGVFDEQNARARKKGNRDRIQSWAQFIKTHPVREAVIQLGDVTDQPPDDEWLVKYALPRFERLMREAGGEIISMDIHNDEATPHAHVRYAMRDSSGKLNVTGCLREHGYERKNLGEKEGKWNHPAQSFLFRAHEVLEDAADEYLSTLGREKVDRERQNRGYGHEDVGRYKARKRHEDEIKELQSVALQLRVENMEARWEAEKTRASAASRLAAAGDAEIRARKREREAAGKEMLAEASLRSATIDLERKKAMTRYAEAELERKREKAKAVEAETGEFLATARSALAGARKEKEAARAEAEKVQREREAVEKRAEAVTEAATLFGNFKGLRLSWYERLFQSWLSRTDEHSGRTNADALVEAGVRPDKLRDVARVFHSFFSHCATYIRDVILGRALAGDERLAPEVQEEEPQMELEFEIDLSTKSRQRDREMSM